MNKKIQVSANASPLWKKFAMGATASAVVIAGLASATNVDPIPTISNTFAVDGQTIWAADINKLAESVNLLDVRTNNFKDNVTVIDNGNVGIGTRTPQKELVIVDNQESTGQGLEIDAHDTGLTRVFSYNRDTSNYTPLRLEGDNLRFSTGATSSTERMIIDVDGNVGIGTTTPGAKLDIFAGSNTEPALHVQNTGGNGAGLKISAATTGAGDVHLLDVGNFDGTSRMVVNAGGNVGIGTTTPSAILDVRDGVNSRLFKYDSAINTLHLQSEYDASGSTSANLSLKARGGSRWRHAGLGLTSNSLIFYNSDDNTDFLTGEKMRITSNGNLGIGTTSPTAKLHVAGDALATVWNTTSDERKKENIEIVENALEKISEIDGVSFTWKEGGLETYGLIAQNVETVFPELVTTADDEMGTKSVNYDGLAGPMVEAIKELNEENEAKDAQIEALIERIEALESAQ